MASSTTRELLILKKKRKQQEDALRKRLGGPLPFDFKGKLVLKLFNGLDSTHQGTFHTIHRGESADFTALARRCFENVHYSGTPDKILHTPSGKKVESFRDLMQLVADFRAAARRSKGDHVRGGQMPPPPVVLIPYGWKFDASKLPKVFQVSGCNGPTSDAPSSPRRRPNTAVLQGKMSVAKAEALEEARRIRHGSATAGGRVGVAALVDALRKENEPKADIAKKGVTGQELLTASQKRPGTAPARTLALRVQDNSKSSIIAGDGVVFRSSPPRRSGMPGENPLDDIEMIAEEEVGGDEEENDGLAHSREELLGTTTLAVAASSGGAIPAGEVSKQLRKTKSFTENTIERVNDLLRIKYDLRSLPKAKATLKLDGLGGMELNEDEKVEDDGSPDPAQLGGEALIMSDEGLSDEVLFASTAAEQRKRVGETIYRPGQTFTHQNQRLVTPLERNTEEVFQKVSPRQKKESPHDGSHQQLINRPGSAATRESARTPSVSTTSSRPMSANLQLGYRTESKGGRPAVHDPRLTFLSSEAVAKRLQLLPGQRVFMDGGRGRPYSAQMIGTGGYDGNSSAARHRAISPQGAGESILSTSLHSVGQQHIPPSSSSAGGLTSPTGTIEGGGDHFSKINSPTTSGASHLQHKRSSSIFGSVQRQRPSTAGAVPNPSARNSYFASILTTDKTNKNSSSQLRRLSQAQVDAVRKGSIQIEVFGKDAAPTPTSAVTSTTQVLSPPPVQTTSTPGGRRSSETLSPESDSGQQGIQQAVTGLVTPPSDPFDDDLRSTVEPPPAAVLNSSNAVGMMPEASPTTNRRRRSTLVSPSSHGFDGFEDGGGTGGSSSVTSRSLTPVNQALLLASGQSKKERKRSIAKFAAANTVGKKLALYQATKRSVPIELPVGVLRTPFGEKIQLEGGEIFADSIVCLTADCSLWKVECIAHKPPANRAGTSDAGSAIFGGSQSWLGSASPTSSIRGNGNPNSVSAADFLKQRSTASPGLGSDTMSSRAGSPTYRNRKQFVPFAHCRRLWRSTDPRIQLHLDSQAATIFAGTSGKCRIPETLSLMTDECRDIPLKALRLTNSFPFLLWARLDWEEGRFEERLRSLTVEPCIKNGHQRSSSPPKNATDGGASSLTSVIGHPGLGAEKTICPACGQNFMPSILNSGGASTFGQSDAQFSPAPPKEKSPKIAGGPSSIARYSGNDEIESDEEDEEADDSRRDEDRYLLPTF